MILKKTYHALERQYLRNMSDYDIKKTVQEGTKHTLKDEYVIHGEQWWSSWAEMVLL